MSAERFDIASYLRDFVFQEDAFSGETAGKRTRVERVTIAGREFPKFTGEFWTSKQRQASSLHEIAYRACFKPQLPRFFIQVLSRAGDLVYDPFSGRGTTAIEAALSGRNVAANDINPLSAILARPRLHVPNLSELKARLDSIPILERVSDGSDLSMFYHPDTFREIVSLRAYLADCRRAGEEDYLDAWIRMVATNRLTGHSTGFFSVYTLPPNQAVSPGSQARINEKRRQVPEYRDTRALILRKSRQLVAGLGAEQIAALNRAGASARFLDADARHTPEVADGSVQLTVTSPPFLDVVQYAQDNWLRCWFNRIDAQEVARNLTLTRTIEEWSEVMGQVFDELFRVTRPGGWVAFEVGEVRNGKVLLEEHVVPLATASGFICEGILINQQEFTKTANIWGIRNNTRGTNTNRIVILRKTAN